MIVCMEKSKGDGERVEDSGRGFYTIFQVDNLTDVSMGACAALYCRWILMPSAAGGLFLGNSGLTRNVERFGAKKVFTSRGFLSGGESSQSMGLVSFFDGVEWVVYF